jgi:segregation and condensation protein B
LTILESLLFVGDRQGRPLSVEQAADSMRGVKPEEVPPLVEQLNARYRADGCPYEIASRLGGYAMDLRQEFAGVRNRFLGRVREARLSQAAVDVLSIVAYRQPVTAEELNRLRGRSSSHVLAQLVRRQLLRIERPQGRAGPARYHTTDRFLRLFGLERLDDLPQTEELENR